MSSTSADLKDTQHFGECRPDQRLTAFHLIVSKTTFRATQTFSGSTAFLCSFATIAICTYPAMRLRLPSSVWCILLTEEYSPVKMETIVDFA
jgi:hypothetical protein